MLKEDAKKTKYSLINANEKKYINDYYFYFCDYFHLFIKFQFYYLLLNNGFFILQSKSHKLTCNYSPLTNVLTFANIQPGNLQFFYLKQFSNANFNITETEMAVIFTQIQELYDYIKTGQQKLILTNRSLKVPIQINKKSKIIEIKFTQTPFSYLQSFYRMTNRNLQNQIKQKAIDIQNCQQKLQQQLKIKEEQIKKIYRQVKQRQNLIIALRRTQQQKQLQMTQLKKHLKSVEQIYNEQKIKSEKSSKQIKKLKLLIKEKQQQSCKIQKHNNFLLSENDKKLRQMQSIIIKNKSQIQNLKKINQDLKINSEKILKTKEIEQINQINLLKSHLSQYQQVETALKQEMNLLKIHFQEQKRQLYQKVTKIIQFQQKSTAYNQLLNEQKNQIANLNKQLAQKNHKIYLLQRNFDQEIQKFKNQGQFTEIKMDDLNRTLITEGIDNIDQINDLINQDSSIVQVIHLSNLMIGDKELQLLMSKQWPNLKQLHIFNNKITSIQSIKRLKLSEITNLSLQGNLLNKEAAAFLIKQKWNKLQYLGLSFIEDNNEESWKILTINKLKQFNSLTNLWIVGCQNLSFNTKQLICDWWRADKLSRNLFWEDKNGNSIGKNDSYQKLI